ncbi:MAG: DNA adenine methylase [Nitrososphaeraceae archaeon]
MKWAGGKTQLLYYLHKKIPSSFNRYFEPFLGGGAMFFHLVNSQNCKFDAYLSDINSELINTYNMIVNNVDELIKTLKGYQYEYKKSPTKFYYNLRTKTTHSSSLEKAARFITLNKTCYNGLYRVNKKGLFNVPIGRYKNPIICDDENLKNVSKILQMHKIKILSIDYKKILLEAKEDDFVYLDPPYKPTSITANFTSYTNNGFTDNDQKDLAKIFKDLANRKCKVLLSNSNTPYILDLYNEFSDNIKLVAVSRLINSKSSYRLGYKELLISNYTN